VCLNPRGFMGTRELPPRPRPNPRPVRKPVREKAAEHLS
jgi:hypothetical protein